jgi:hypothetical protein
MTVACQTAKKQRVDSIKGGGQWEFSTNIGEFLSGSAEVTGRTLKLVEFFPGAMMGGINATAQGVGKLVLGTGKLTTNAVVGTGQFTKELVVGTGKVSKDIVVGTGQFTKDIVVGTGKVGYDVVVGTGKIGKDVVVGTGRVVVGTGKLATDAVVGTGQVLVTGITEVGKGTGRAVVGTGKAVRRATTALFSVADLIRGRDLQEGKQNLKHVELSRPTSPKAAKGSIPRPSKLSPKGRARSLGTIQLSKRGNLMAEEDDVLDELTEMEMFMKHLKGMDPDQIQQVLNDSRTRIEA